MTRTKKARKEKRWPYWLHINTVAGDLLLMVRDENRPRGQWLTARISAGSLDQLAKFARRPGEPAGFTGVTYTMTTLAQMNRIVKTRKIPPLLAKAFGELAGEDKRAYEEMEQKRADIEREAVNGNNQP